MGLIKSNHDPKQRDIIVLAAAIFQHAVRRYKSRSQYTTKLANITLSEIITKLADQSHKCAATGKSFSYANNHPHFPAVTFTSNKDGFDLISMARSSAGPLHPKVKHAGHCCPTALILADVICAHIKDIKFQIEIRASCGDSNDMIVGGIIYGPNDLLPIISISRKDGTIYAHNCIDRFGKQNRSTSSASGYLSEPNNSIVNKITTHLDLMLEQYDLTNT